MKDSRLRLLINGLTDLQTDPRRRFRQSVRGKQLDFARTTIDRTVTQRSMTMGSEMQPRKHQSQSGSGIAVGAGVGLALGLAFDQMALGLALGTAFGALIDAIPGKSHKQA